MPSPDGSVRTVVKTRPAILAGVNHLSDLSASGIFLIMIREQESGRPPWEPSGC